MQGAGEAAPHSRTIIWIWESGRLGHFKVGFIKLHICLKQSENIYCQAQGSAQSYITTKTGAIPACRELQAWCVCGMGGSLEGEVSGGLWADGD